MTATEKVTISIEEAGKRLGICRTQAYRAAKAGLIPTLRVGSRKHVVPVSAFERMLAEAGR